MDKDWKWPTCEKDWKWPTCEMMTHSPCSSIQQGRAVTSHFMCLSAASIVALEAEGGCRVYNYIVGIAIMCIVLDAEGGCGVHNYIVGIAIMCIEICNPCISGQFQA